MIKIYVNGNPEQIIPHKSIQDLLDNNKAIDVARTTADYAFPVAALLHSFRTQCIHGPSAYQPGQGFLGKGFFG